MQACSAVFILATSSPLSEEANKEGSAKILPVEEPNQKSVYDDDLATAQQFYGGYGGYGGYGWGGWGRTFGHHGFGHGHGHGGWGGWGYPGHGWGGGWGGYGQISSIS